MPSAPKPYGQSDRHNHQGAGRRASELDRKRTYPLVRMAMINERRGMLWEAAHILGIATRMDPSNERIRDEYSRMRSAAESSRDTAPVQCPVPEPDDEAPFDELFHVSGPEEVEPEAVPAVVVEEPVPEPEPEPEPPEVAEQVPEPVQEDAPEPIPEEGEPEQTSPYPEIPAEPAADGAGAGSSYPEIPSDASALVSPSPAPEIAESRTAPGGRKHRHSIANDQPQALVEALQDPLIHEIVDLFDGKVVDIHR